MTELDYDIAIAGGGLVGAALAVALAPLGLRIGLIEARPPQVPVEDIYNERSVALSYASKRILQGMGVWPALADAAVPMTQVHVSQRGRFGVTRLHAVDEHLPALGYVIVNRYLIGALLERLSRQAGVTMLAPSTVSAVEHHDDHVALTVQGEGGERTLRARLLAVADGTRSPTRALLGVGVLRRVYDQSAVIANVTTARPNRGVAYERFTPQGPVALLPLGEDRAALVWTQTPEQTAVTLTWDDATYLAALQAHFGHRLGHFVRAGRREAYPLERLRAERLTVGRALLVGNAAHTVHPIAGQGFNLALRDVATLAELVGASDDPGSSAVLSEYARLRTPDIDRTLAATDGLLRLFTNPFPPLASARSLGLALLDVLPSLKHRVARAGMGLEWASTGRLARGLPLTGVMS